MTAVVWNERAVAPNNRFPASGFTGANQGLMGNREKNLVNCWCAYVFAQVRPVKEVFEVGISRVSEGLHSVERVATFNREKNLVSEILAGLRW